MKKIVVIGPESTGKSTLCQKLAQHYHTDWCPEYARQYLLEHGTNYTYDTLLHIAKGQIALEDKHLGMAEKKHRSLLFIDTDMHVMDVWCKFVFGKTHSWILNQIVERKYDLYLLCNVDLPWVKDALREYPDIARRKKLYDIYREIMLRQSVPWIDISGDYDLRLKKAIEAVDKLT